MQCALLDAIVLAVALKNVVDIGFTWKSALPADKRVVSDVWIEEINSGIRLVKQTKRTNSLQTTLENIVFGSELQAGVTQPWTACRILPIASQQT